uniref:Uncharacterized protein n=1 Tax=Rhizophora mucronata TaxID=61149 RepID=A0A2P2PP98_RHIMU
MKILNRYLGYSLLFGIQTVSFSLCNIFKYKVLSFMNFVPKL